MKVELFDVMVFAAVVRAKGFSAAARELDLPPSAVSRRVKRLETALGTMLLHRTTRQVGLTAAGRVYYERIAPVPRLLDEAERALLDLEKTPQGTLRIAAPPEDGGVIWAALRSFLLHFPDVDIEIFHSLEYIDIIDRDIDVALRGGSPPDSADLSAKLIWNTRMLLAASPEYLELHGTPQAVDDLNRHVGICMDTWAPNALRALSGDRDLVRVTMKNRVRANSLETARLAALDGFGIAPLMALSCQMDLDRGALVEVLYGSLPLSAKGWVVYPVNKRRSAAASALIDHLVRHGPTTGAPAQRPTTGVTSRNESGVVDEGSAG